MNVTENLNKEILKMRGYSFNKVETNRTLFKKNGSIETDISSAKDIDVEAADIPSAKDIDIKAADKSIEKDVTVKENNDAADKSVQKDVTVKENDDLPVVRTNQNNTAMNGGSSVPVKSPSPVTKKAAPPSLTDPEPDNEDKSGDKCACIVM